MFNSGLMFLVTSSMAKVVSPHPDKENYTTRMILTLHIFLLIGLLYMIS